MPLSVDFVAAKVVAFFRTGVVSVFLRHFVVAEAVAVAVTVVVVVVVVVVAAAVAVVVVAVAAAAANTTAPADSTVSDLSTTVARIRSARKVRAGDGRPAD